LDLRVAFQIVTFILLAITLIAYCIIHKKFGYTPRKHWGIIALIMHLMIFYVFVIFRSLGIFDLTIFIDELFGVGIISFGTWSAAIRLQTAIELLLMSLSILRVRNG